MGTHMWWVIFPILGIMFGFFAMWLKHKRHNSIIELIKVYVAQGKEPPQELLNSLKNWEETQATGAPRAWRRVATFGSLTVGFGAAYLAMVPDIMSPGRAHPFLVTAILMAALTFSSLINVLIQRKYDAK